MLRASAAQTKDLSLNFQYKELGVTRHTPVAPVLWQAETGHPRGLLDANRARGSVRDCVAELDNGRTGYPISSSGFSKYPSPLQDQVSN